MFLKGFHKIDLEEQKKVRTQRDNFLSLTTFLLLLCCCRCLYDFHLVLIGIRITLNAIIKIHIYSS